MPELFGRVGPGFLGHEAVEAGLSVVAEGSVADVVADGDGLGEFGVQPQVFCDRGGDARNMLNMLHARADVVVVGRKEDLGLVLEAAVGLAVQEAGVVTLKG